MAPEPQPARPRQWPLGRSPGGTRQSPRDVLRGSFLPEKGRNALRATLTATGPSRGWACDVGLPKKEGTEPGVQHEPPAPGPHHRRPHPDTRPQALPRSPAPAAFPRRRHPHPSASRGASGPLLSSDLPRRHLMLSLPVTVAWSQKIDALADIFETGRPHSAPLWTKDSAWSSVAPARGLNFRVARLRGFFTFALRMAFRPLPARSRPPRSKILFLLTILECRGLM